VRGEKELTLKKDQREKAPMLTLKMGGVRITKRLKKKGEE